MDLGLLHYDIFNSIGYKPLQIMAVFFDPEVERTGNCYVYCVVDDKMYLKVRLDTKKRPFCSTFVRCNKMRLGATRGATRCNNVSSKLAFFNDTTMTKDQNDNDNISHIEMSRWLCKQEGRKRKRYRITVRYGLFRLIPV
jgi:hypothetical protein